MQERQPRLDAVQAKMQKIMQQQIALNQKQDYEGAENLQPQLKAAEKEYEKLMNEVYDPAAMAATDKEFNKDLEMFISVRVNPATKTVGAGRHRHRAARRRANRLIAGTSRTRHESNDHALYLFGAWKQSPDGRWQQTARAGAAPPSAHGVAVQVTGRSGARHADDRRRSTSQRSPPPSSSATDAAISRPGYRTRRSSFRSG